MGVSSVEANPASEPARIGTAGLRILFANVVAEVGIVITGGPGPPHWVWAGLPHLARVHRGKPGPCPAAV